MKTFWSHNAVLDTNSSALHRNSLLIYTVFDWQIINIHGRKRIMRLKEDNYIITGLFIWRIFWYIPTYITLITNKEVTIVVKNVCERGFPQSKIKNWLSTLSNKCPVCSDSAFQWKYAWDYSYELISICCPSSCNAIAPIAVAHLYRLGASQIHKTSVS